MQTCHRRLLACHSYRHRSVPLHEEMFSQTILLDVLSLLHHQRILSWAPPLIKRSLPVETLRDCPCSQPYQV
jgi:hypothetical protein